MRVVQLVLDMKDQNPNGWHEEQHPWRDREGRTGSVHGLHGTPSIVVANTTRSVAWVVMAPEEHSP